jgi:hypothetical protein
MSYVLAGYGLTIALLAGYAWRVLRRARVLQQESRSWPT